MDTLSTIRKSTAFHVCAIYLFGAVLCEGATLNFKEPQLVSEFTTVRPREIGFSEKPPRLSVLGWGFNQVFEVFFVPPGESHVNLLSYELRRMKGAVVTLPVAVVSYATMAADGSVVAYVPDGASTRIALFYAKTGKVAELGEDDSDILRMVFAPNGDILLVLTKDGNLHRWELQKKATMKSIDLGIKPNGASLVATTKHCYVGNSSGIIMSVSIDLDKVIFTVDKSLPVTALMATTDDDLLAFALADGTVGVIDVREKRTLWKKVVHDKSIDALHFAFGGKVLLCGGSDGLLVGVSGDSGTEYARTELRSAVDCLSVREVSSTVYVGLRNGRLLSMSMEMIEKRE